MESWSEVLRGVLDAPGVRYTCLADPATGAVVAAHGRAGPGDPAGAVPDEAAAVLGWGAAELGPGAAGIGFQDGVITTGATYHLVRTLRRDGTTMLAYLQVDRVRGNLALARRALLALPTDDQVPVPHPRRPGETPEPAGRSAADRAPAVPLPRREAGPGGAPPSAVAPSTSPSGATGEVPAVPLSAPPGQPGGRWADDLRTMARILAGLRRLDEYPTAGS
ncbi:hypothetical protein H7X46_25565 [Pseudonocardia sp. C8]|uniref:hypothetical protein n=1 Tax=Pseudonocardia sp. C8 TaxID=2762759 RepID=UPI0016431C2D|nr:hypothetical protein [Pseudonocardia sp. C8]MBC3194423.1 hypothetical protein [Pseudonocardia sp. C8]